MQANGIGSQHGVGVLIGAYGRDVAEVTGQWWRCCASHGEGICIDPCGER